MLGKKRLSEEQRLNLEKLESAFAGVGVLKSNEHPMSNRGSNTNISIGVGGGKEVTISSGSGSFTGLSTTTGSSSSGGGGGGGGVGLGTPRKSLNDLLSASSAAAAANSTVHRGSNSSLDPHRRKSSNADSLLGVDGGAASDGGGSGGGSSGSRRTSLGVTPASGSRNGSKTDLLQANGPMSHMLICPPETLCWTSIKEGYLRRNASSSSGKYKLFWFVLKQDHETLESRLECYGGRVLQSHINLAGSRITPKSASEFLVTNGDTTWHLQTEDQSAATWTVALQVAADSIDEILRRQTSRHASQENCKFFSDLVCFGMFCILFFPIEYPSSFFKK